MAGALTRILVETAHDEIDKRADRCVSVAARCTKMQKRSLGGLHPHDPDRALGVDPRAVHLERQFHRCRETLGELGQLDRGAGVQPDLVGEERGSNNGRLGHGHESNPHSSYLAAAYCGDNSSAIRFTVSSDEPPDASVAAITAPSTIGALHTATRPRRFSSSISTAISLLVSAPPRSTRITTPAGVQARSIAARMAATSVPRPPSALPPVKARGTVSPTICRTMSAAPSATLLEWETMTTPTFAAAFRVIASTPDRVADGRDHQRGGSRSGIEVPNRPLAEK